MLATRKQRLTIKRRRRLSDERHGFTHEFLPVTTVWGAISPTLGGGRRERQIFGPRIEFEMNAMGLFSPNTDVRVTDTVTVRGDEYEVLAVVNSMYKDRSKFAALKHKVELQADPFEGES